MLSIFHHPSDSFCHFWLGIPIHDLQCKLRVAYGFAIFQWYVIDHFEVHIHMSFFYPCSSICKCLTLCMSILMALHDYGISIIPSDSESY
jgi:hypothetical protein